MDGQPADYKVITEATFAAQEDFNRFRLEAARADLRI
jgi:hypothetical protein